MATLTHSAREANRAADNRVAVTPPDQFSNEPMIDWTNPENLRRMTQATIDKVRSELGLEYDLVIGGRRVKTADYSSLDQSGQAFGSGCGTSPGGSGRS